MSRWQRRSPSMHYAARSVDVIGEPARVFSHYNERDGSNGETMRSCLLYLIGVPIPLIILLWLITGHA